MIVLLNFLLYLNQYKCKQVLEDDTKILDDAYNISKKALLEFSAKNTKKAEDIFVLNWNKHSNDMIFQEEYIKFFIRVGKYERILGLKNVKGLKNQKLVEAVKDYNAILKSKNEKDICGLIEVSPDSERILETIINYNIRVKDFLTAEKYLDHYQNIYSVPSSKLNQLKLAIYFGQGKHEEGLSVLQNTPGMREVYRKYYDLYSSFNSVKMDNNMSPRNKLNYLNQICNQAMVNNISFKGSNSTFNPFEPLYITVATFLIEYGIKVNYSQTLSVADRLAQIHKTKQSIINHIRAALVANNVSRARELYDDNKNELDGSEAKYLDTLIRNEETKEERRQEELRKQRLEREKREQEEKENALKRYATDKAGRDFLGYYRILDATKNTSAKDLKVKHRKAMKRASKRANANKDSNMDSRDAEMMKLNKAYQVLTDSYKKKAYDLGIDPDNLPQDHGQQYQNYQQQGHNVYEQHDMQDILNTIFGGGGNYQQRGRGGRTTYQYYFFN